MEILELKSISEMKLLLMDLTVVYQVFIICLTKDSNTCRQGPENYLTQEEGGREGEREKERESDRLNRASVTCR